MFKGFFSRMYNGNPNRPDLRPQDMPKNRVAMYFSVLRTRLSDILRLSLLHFFTLLPLLVWIMLSIAAVLQLETPDMGQDYVNELVGTVQTFFLGLIPCLLLAALPTAGATFVAMKWARDENTWLWQDFKQGIKENWKQSLVFALVLGILLLMCVVALNYYSAAAAEIAGMFVLQVIIALVGGILLLAYLFIFPMMITFRMSVLQIFRNSLLLTLGRLPLAVLFGAITALPLVVGGIGFISSFSFWSLAGLVLFYALFGLGFTAYTNASFAQASFVRFMGLEEGGNEEPEDEWTVDEPLPEDQEPQGDAEDRVD